MLVPYVKNYYKPCRSCEIARRAQARMPLLLELELEGELDGAGAADLVQGVEAAIRSAGTQAAG
jgi:hypothetical protein